MAVTASVIFAGLLAIALATATPQNEQCLGRGGPDACTPGTALLQSASVRVTTEPPGEDPTQSGQKGGPQVKPLRQQALELAQQPLAQELLAQQQATPSHQGLRSSASAALDGENITMRGTRQVLKCGETKIVHPDDVSCPVECAFLRLETKGFCAFSCVGNESCNAHNPVSNFPDPTNHRCGPCLVKACIQCVGNNLTCNECDPKFELIEGKCYGKDRWYWRTIYIIMAVVGAFFTLYLIILIWVRPERNPEGLVSALSFRTWSKQLDGEHDMKHYSLLEHFRKRSIGGVATMLHFDWQFWILIWSFVTCLLFSVLALIFPTRPSAMKYHPTDPRSYEACNHAIEDQKQEVIAMTRIYWYAVLALYICTSIAFVALTRYHNYRYRTQRDEDDTINDFALVLRGLPDNIGGHEHIEDDLRALLKERLGEEIVGVSVSWRFYEEAAEVQTYARRMLRKQEEYIEKELGKTLKIEDESREAIERVRKHFEKRDPDNKALHPVLCYRCRSEYQEASGQELWQCCLCHAHNREKRYTCLECTENGYKQSLCWECFVKRQRKPTDKEWYRHMWWVDEYIDMVSLGMFLPKPQQKSRDEITEMLEQFETSGMAVVIFETERAKYNVLEKLGTTCLEYEKFNKKHKLQLTEEDWEPSSVLWENFGRSDVGLYVRLVIGICGIVVIMFVMDGLFYFPYVKYLQGYKTIPLLSEGYTFQTLLLGMLITLDNQILYFAAGMVAKWVGFRLRGERQQAYVIMYTIAVLTNTIIDLWTLVQLAQGTSRVDLQMMNLMEDSIWSPETLANHPGLQRAIFDQLFSYLYPGCLVLGFLAEPFALGFVPYFYYVAIVRSRADVSQNDAEESLACQAFDLSRYGDISINVMLCLCMCAFTYRALWQLFFFLFLSHLCIYLWDKFRLVRLSQTTHFAMAYTDRCAFYLGGICPATLAAVLVWRYYELFFWSTKSIHSGAEARVQHKHCIIWALLAFFVHFGGHCLLTTLFVEGNHNTNETKGKDKTITYREVSAMRPRTYFSTNPVHCLRSKYIYGKRGFAGSEAPCLPYLPGKIHLIVKNEDVGVFYDGMDDQKKNPFTHACTTKAASVSWRSLAHLWHPTEVYKWDWESSWHPTFADDRPTA